MWLSAMLSLLLLSISDLSSAEVFSAIHKFETLFQNEKIIIDEIWKLSQNLKQISNDLERSHKQLMENHASEENSEERFSNPLNCFKLIKRTTFDLKITEKRITREIRSFVDHTGKFATESDLRGVVEGILRIQKIYKVETASLSEGEIDNKKISPALMADDLHLIGLKARELNEEFLAQEYLTLALEKYDDREKIDEVLLDLAESYKAVGDNRNAIVALDKILDNDPTKITAFLMRSEIEGSEIELPKLINPFDENFEKNGKYHLNKEEFLYRKACRGELRKTMKEMSKLYCRLQSANLFTKIAPFKVEELNLKPNILLFHDVISDREIHYLKNSSKFVRAATFVSNLEISNTRIAQVAWHNDEDTIVKKISQRIGDMTNLSLASSENLQVQNYGIGGHYQLHFDHRLKNQKEFDIDGGNRLATVLLYMSDVEKGGATVLPYLNIYVPVQKNTAIFWYNLKPSGISEHLSRHAGCPVVIGSKWVANKWIHEHRQSLTCPVDSFEGEIEISEYFGKYF